MKDSRTELNQGSCCDKLYLGKVRTSDSANSDPLPKVMDNRAIAGRAAKMLVRRWMVSSSFLLDMGSARAGGSVVPPE